MKFFFYSSSPNVDIVFNEDRIKWLKMNVETQHLDVKEKKITQSLNVRRSKHTILWTEKRRRKQKWHKQAYVNETTFDNSDSSSSLFDRSRSTLLAQFRFSSRFFANTLRSTSTLNKNCNRITASSHFVVRPFAFLVTSIETQTERKRVMRVCSQYKQKYKLNTSTLHYSGK